MGVHLAMESAGIDHFITGFDINPQPRYPFNFVQADALSVDLSGFDAVWASPPCQAFTSLKNMPNARVHVDLVGITREKLQAIGAPYIIENVVGAPLVNPIRLCGTSFGLGCGLAELRRHRIFETHPQLLLAPPCVHGGKSRTISVLSHGGSAGLSKVNHARVIGVYGHSGGLSAQDRIRGFTNQERSEAMGIDWMVGDELAQAIPPAYSKYLWGQLILAIAGKENL